MSVERGMFEFGCQNGLRGRSPSQHLLARIVLIAVMLCGWRASGSAPGADLFTNGAVSKLVIEITPANIERLRKEPRTKVPAVVKEGGTVYRDVAIHLKGALGSFREIGDKPGLTLNFGYLTPEQRFHGLRKIMLNNSVQDPTWLNEKVAGDLFRAAGVPCPRTSHALVELNGRKLGLYVLKEGFGKEFFTMNFSNNNGNQYDINQGFYDLGPGNDLQKRFRLDSGKGAKDVTDIAALIAACQEKDPAARWNKLNSSLDMEKFISFMAMEIITCHRDGYSVYGHNFRLYNDSRTHRFVFIPNDMDQMFQDCRASVLDPGFSALAAAAVFQTPQGRQQYTARCAWLCTNGFNLARLTNDVITVSAHVQAAAATDDPHAAKLVREGAAIVCERLKKRAAVIAAAIK